MSLASEGSVTENVGGQPGGAQSASENGSAGASANSPWAGLQDADNRTWVEKKGWKSSDEEIKSHRELESKLGSAITKPADDAPPEAWDKVFAKLGRPEKPDAYDLKRTEGLPADLPWDEEGEKVLRTLAFEAGNNQKQAQHFLDGYARFTAKRAEQQIIELSKSVETTQSDLVNKRKWGLPESETFKAKNDFANRTVNKFGLNDELKKYGFITHDGALTSSVIGDFLATVGERLLAEDKIDGVAAKAAGVNPFKKGSEHSVTGQSLAIKEDPKRAFQLARDAGHSEDQAHMLVYGHARK